MRARTGGLFFAHGLDGGYENQTSPLSLGWVEVLNVAASDFVSGVSAHWGVSSPNRALTVFVSAVSDPTGLRQLFLYLSAAFGLVWGRLAFELGLFFVMGTSQLFVKRQPRNSQLLGGFRSLLLLNLFGFAALHTLEDGGFPILHALPVCEQYVLPL